MKESFYAIGSLLAVILSWSISHSFWWCVLHFIFGWLYVVYWICVYYIGAP